MRPALLVFSSVVMPGIPDVVVHAQAAPVSLARLERDVAIGVETQALFIRLWLNTTPPLPEQAAKAARAQSGARYDNFIARLGRRLSEGPKLRQEIPEDVREGSICFSNAD
jgi:hypothetical protein